MLCYANCALVVGLRSADTLGMDAADTANQAQEAIAGVHATVQIEVKIRADFELAGHDWALASLTSDAEECVR